MSKTMTLDEYEKQLNETIATCEMYGLRAIPELFTFDKKLIRVARAAFKYYEVTSPSEMADWKHDDELAEALKEVGL